MHIRLDWNFVQTKERRFQLIFCFPPTTTQPPTQIQRSELRSGRGTLRHLLLHHSRITFPHRIAPNTDITLYSTSSLVGVVSSSLLLCLSHSSSTTSATGFLRPPACSRDRSLALRQHQFFPYFPLSTQRPPLVGSAPQSRAHRHLFLGTSTRRPGYPFLSILLHAFFHPYFFCAIREIFRPNDAEHLPNVLALIPYLRIFAFTRPLYSAVALSVHFRRFARISRSSVVQPDFPGSQQLAVIHDLFLDLTRSSTDLQSSLRSSPILSTLSFSSR